jgi:hypothetical protein
MPNHVLAPLGLSEAERSELMSLASRPKTAQALALRARIILACAEGGQNKAVAAQLGVERQTAGKWRQRFVEHRIDGLRDEPRSGAPRTIDDDAVLSNPGQGIDDAVLGAQGKGAAGYDANPSPLAASSAATI